MSDERPGTGRTTLVIVMVVIGALLVGLGVMAFWADRTFLDEDGLASLADDLLAREEVQTAFTERIVDGMLEDARPAAQLAKPLLREVVGSFVGSDAFAEVLSGALRRSYGALLNAEAPDVVLELPDALPKIKEVVAKLDPQLAASIPDGSRLEALVVSSQAIVKPLRFADKAAGVLGWVFFLVGVGLMVGGVFLSRRPPWAGTVAGAALAGWTGTIAVVLLICKLIIVGGISDPTRQAAVQAGWEVVFRGVQVSLLVVALIGVLIILVSRLYAGEGRPTSIRDLGTRPIAAIVLVLGVILVVGPHPGPAVLAVLTGVAFLAAGLVWMFPGLLSIGRDEEAPLD